MHPAPISAVHLAPYRRPTRPVAPGPVPVPMSGPRTALAGLLLAMAAAAAAQTTELTARDGSRPPASEDRREWEGAIGLVVNNAPSFAGASDRTTNARPAGFLRYGRFTLASSGGFSTARRETVDGGLGARLGGGNERIRWSVGLRREGGRGETDSPTLAGLGTIPSTIQGRVSARWNAAPRTQLRALVAFDVLGRVPGSETDLSLTHSWPLDADTALSANAGIGFGSRSFNRVWHGVTPEQSARSGKPVYEPGAGARGVRVGLTWRSELGPRAAGFVGVGVSRLVGPAADSPLAGEPTGVSASAGLVYRF